jgi:hypothetical protein
MSLENGGGGGILTNMVKHEEMNRPSYLGRMLLGLMIHGKIHPWDNSSKGRIVKGTYRTKGASSKGRIGRFCKVCYLFYLSSCSNCFLSSVPRSRFHINTRVYRNSKICEEIKLSLVLPESEDVPLVSLCSTCQREKV